MTTSLLDRTGACSAGWRELSPFGLMGDLDLDLDRRRTMRGPVPDGPKIGVLVPPDMPAGQLTSYARRAEELGFGEVWVVEDCFLHGAFAQAAAILASTGTLRVGLGILPAAARNVAFAAMEIATMASMHPGLWGFRIRPPVMTWASMRLARTR
jgi:hypothetical protein